uniref:Myocardin n=1 Tax=Poecilia mexicana TaxID=48701 RepID=A0A3B3X8U2_9TELE
SELRGRDPSLLLQTKADLRLQQRRTREQLADQGIMPRECNLHVLTDRSIFVPPTVNHGKFPKQEDSYAFEEDSSSESLSPEQNHSDESQGSACPSSDAVGSTASSSSSPALTSPRQVQPIALPVFFHPSVSLLPVPSHIRASTTSDKNRHKKPKDVKPKVKKLKYHQYIPPDQKVEKSPPPMDSAYARLLQQQQLFLQLQILSQQKHTHTHSQMQQPQQQHIHSMQAHVPSCASSGPASNSNSNSSSPIKNTFPNQNNVSPVKVGPLPANLDDLKVSELRQHLRIRGMPVSGTKQALIERLRPFRDSNADSSPSGSSDITTLTFPVTPTGSLSSYQSPSSSSNLSQGGYFPFPSTSSTPPISPASSDLSLSGSLPDSFSDVPMSSPNQFNLQPSPTQTAIEDGLGAGGGGSRVCGGNQRVGEDERNDGSLEAEKDKMLVEKQRVIEELTWKLHQEQRQVEELKMQLHKRKRSFGQATPMMGQHFLGVTIKQEPMSLSSSCPLSSSKQLKTFLSPQCSPQDSPVGKPTSSSQPPSPNSPYLLSPLLGRDSCGHPHGQGRALPSSRHVGQKCQVSPPAFSSSDSDASDLRQPPCYEDAVKQQMTRSQQMDELLDVLIESGEMPANAREERERSSVTQVVPHITVSPGCPGLLIPRFHWHYEHLSPNQIPYDHAANHATESHLQTLLGNPMGRGGEMGLLKMATEDGHQEEEGNRDAEDKVFAVPEVQGMVSMAFSETPWETMEWLDLTPPSSATAFGGAAQPSAPSIFNTEFLDVTDINLNSAMDLQLEHW